MGSTRQAFRSGTRPWLAVLVLAALAGCASVPHLDFALRQPPPAPLLRFGEDTFAFANEVRAITPDKEDIYANYCFVLTRGVVQFLKFARFDPDSPRLPSHLYTALVRRVTAHEPWEEALPAERRVTIPGYRNLHEFSSAQEEAVKAGLNSRLWTYLHWTNWRVGFPVAGHSQEGVAEEILAELQAGRPVLLLVTNFPVHEVNHGLVAYTYRVSGTVVDFTVYDPNEPDRPGTITFQAGEETFWATRMFNTRPGHLRVFRMYFSRFL